MIRSSKTKPNSLAAVIVFGRPNGSNLPQASWFKEAHLQEAKNAAEIMKFNVIELRTASERALANGVYEGVLKGSGRMILGSATPETYRRLEDHARKAKGTEQAPKPDENANVGALASTHNTLTDPWDSLKVGSVALTAYWNDKDEPEGWWPVVVTRIDKRAFVLNYRDEPDVKIGKVERKYIALLHPDFLASGE
jgi:hypothetical protein